MAERFNGFGRLVFMSDEKQGAFLDRTLATAPLQRLRPDAIKQKVLDHVKFMKFCLVTLGDELLQDLNSQESYLTNALIGAMMDLDLEMKGSERANQTLTALSDGYKESLGKANLDIKVLQDRLAEKEKDLERRAQIPFDHWKATKEMVVLVVGALFMIGGIHNNYFWVFVLLAGPLLYFIEYRVWKHRN